MSPVPMAYAPYKIHVKSIELVCLEYDFSTRHPTSSFSSGNSCGEVPYAIISLFGNEGQKDKSECINPGRSNQGRHRIIINQ